MTERKNFTLEVAGNSSPAVSFPTTSQLPSSKNSRPVAAQALEAESLSQIINNYIQYYAAGQSHTARAKRYDLEHFLGFLSEYCAKDVWSVTVADWTLQATKDFIEDRLTRGEAPTTAGRRLATVKHFGRTLAERFHGYINPAREAKAPVVSDSRPQQLGKEEILLLRTAALNEVETHKGSFVSVRNRMLLELLLATGLRADEVRVLSIGQVSEDNTWLRKVRTKGRKFRNVYIDSSIIEDFSDYLKLREAELQSRCPEVSNLPASELARLPVFISFRGAQSDLPTTFGLSAKTIWRIISGFGKKAEALSPSPGLKLHPHLLRHSFAHGLLNSSKDVRLVAQALGHSDVRVTMRYTERKDEELAKAIEKKNSREKQSNK